MKMKRAEKHTKPCQPTPRVMIPFYQSPPGTLWRFQSSPTGLRHLPVMIKSKGPMGHRQFDIKNGKTIIMKLGGKGKRLSTAGIKHDKILFLTEEGEYKIGWIARAYMGQLKPCFKSV